MRCVFSRSACTRFGSGVFGMGRAGVRSSFGMVRATIARCPRSNRRRRSAPSTASRARRNSDALGASMRALRTRPKALRSFLSNAFNRASCCSRTICHRAERSGLAVLGPPCGFHTPSRAVAVFLEDRVSPGLAVGVKAGSFGVALRERGLLRRFQGAPFFAGRGLDPVGGFLRRCGYCCPPPSAPAIPGRCWPSRSAGAARGLRSRLRPKLSGFAGAVQARPRPSPAGPCELSLKAAWVCPCAWLDRMRSISGVFRLAVVAEYLPAPPLVSPRP